MNKNNETLIDDEKLLKSKPKMVWEYRIYSSGALIENGIALNETATFVYQQCDGKNTVLDILCKLCEEYDVKESQAKKDLLQLIRELTSGDAIKL